MVAVGIILPIVDGLEPGHGDLELLNNIGHIAVRSAGVEMCANVSICNSPPSRLLATVKRHWIPRLANQSV